MSYTVYDFTETLPIEREKVEKVLAAWGGSPEGGGSWNGGFLLLLKDGTKLYITGWCDYTGWGCQDGTRSEVWESEKLPDHGYDQNYDKVAESEWDIEPADLNRYIKTGEGKWD